MTVFPHVNVFVEFPISGTILKMDFMRKIYFLGKLVILLFRMLENIEEINKPVLSKQNLLVTNIITVPIDIYSRDL